jgi:hypothetical protein
MHARQDVVLLDNPAYSDVQAARDAVPYGPMLDQGHRALSLLTEISLLMHDLNH